ncbi:MAG: Rpn family recombination-promoting nuclease/putative transposase, partial [Desulfobacterales bacterium]|nr:Rpn family recombination-promoting nuclease/putative transposase [Desulfobacterales bacterium]
MCRINPKVKIIFNKLFGSEENKDLLLSLINAILPQSEQITEIKLENPYNISDYINGKISILDVKAKDKDGKFYDIEMQVGEQGYYGKRSLYYWGKTYTNQIDTGEMYSKLKKTVVISILDFKYFKEDSRVH